MGGKTQVVQASPPPPITASQAAAQTSESMQQILEAQLKYQPAFDQATFDSYAKFAPQYAALSQNVLEKYAPEQVKLMEDLAAEATRRYTEGLSKDEENYYADTFKSLVGNQVNAPIGADWVSRQLLQQDLAAKQLGYDIGLSYLGRVPVTQAYQNQSAFQVAPSFGEAFSTATAGQNAFMAASRPLGYETGAQRFGQYATGIGNLMQGGGKMGAVFGMSSIRYKKNVNRIKSALESIERIDPVEFDWKNDDIHDGGVIAEQLEEVLPQAVIEIDGVKHVKPMMLIGYLIGAVKELAARK